MKLSKREQILLIGLLISAIVIIFVMYVYVPISNEINELKEKSTQLSIALQGKQQKQNMADQLANEVIELQAIIDENHKDVMKIWDEPELLVYMEEIVGRFGDKKSISFYDAVNVEWFRSGQVALSFRANYEDLKNILKRFEEGKYYNTLSSVEVNRRIDEDIDDKELDVQLLLNYYILTEGNDYPETYDFITGTYKKRNIFRE